MLKGKQKNLDLNKNGKLDSQDFKMLRGEEMKFGGVTKNEEVIESFLTESKEVGTKNLSTQYKGGKVYLKNYETIIATREGNNIKLNPTKYSNTTTKITNKLESLASGLGLKVEKTTEMKKGGAIKVFIDTDRGTVSETFKGKDEKDAQRKVDAYLNGPGKMWGKKVTVIPFEVDKMKKGGALKPIPKDNKGLPNLPEKVRNNMGYMEKGGEMKWGGKMEDGGEVKESKWVYTIGGLKL